MYCYIPDRHILILRPFMGLEQNLFEGPPEVSVEDGVYDGVQAAVAVSDPEKQVEECLWDDAVLSADGVKAVGEEEREPAEDKHSHHHSQDKGEALLPHLSHFVLGQRHPPAADGERRREEEVLGALVGGGPGYGGAGRRRRRGFQVVASLSIFNLLCFRPASYSAGESQG